MESGDAHQSLHELKATIKAWERGFKIEFSRDPTKDDIKKRPHIRMDREQAR